ncbi:MAG: adenine deaminase [Ignavibacteria bacterium]|nr:adenine deaminase [Ignavibacteria bacterium]
MNKISGNIIDVFNKRIFPGTLTVENQRITEIIEDNAKYNSYILPGLIDSHIHIESSMLVPSEFAKLAVIHGTVATVSDPHEIANVLGMKGIKFMLDNAAQVPFKIYFGAPSCVPATSFETAGAEITAEDIEKLFTDYDLKYLSEMMNFPGVVFGDKTVMEKLSIAIKFDKPVDGHSPGLKGEQLKTYVFAGISTDHECYMLEEAQQKISLGMKVLIREGSAAKNYETLKSLIDSHTDMVMLCSDDKHPDDLVEGHINLLIKRGLKDGFDLFKLLRCCCINPVVHYNLDVGLLRKNDFADFIVIDNIENFNIYQTYINGELVAEKGKSFIASPRVIPVNNFKTDYKKPGDFIVKVFDGEVKIIEALDGELITRETHGKPKIKNDDFVSDVENDILKIAVVNRYADVKPMVSFIKNFGIKRGALASSVAHDSHNIIAIGTSDEELCEAVNTLIETKGGITVVYDGKKEVLPLPVAGIMSDKNGYEVAKLYSEISNKVKELGSSLHSPFMTLSFMALLVIPALKLSDKGLFDGNKFEFTSTNV